MEELDSEKGMVISEMIKENYNIKKREDWSDNDCFKIDDFIMKDSTTGEFINTLNYLDYHPKERFEDDSIAVFDKGSGEVRGVMIAARIGKDIIESYPGTTFAGPIVDRASKLDVIETAMEMMLGYYESKYQEIRIKKIPDYYTKQPFNMIDYILLNRGYAYGMSALTNVIDLGNVKIKEDIWELFDSKKRNHTKKAIKEHMFVFSEGEIQEDAWANMNRNLKNKFNSKTTHTFEEIQELSRRCPEYIKAYYVNTEAGDYAAFALVYLFKNVFHTQYLDMDYKYTGRYPNLLLVYEMIKIAKEKGYEYFSFGASTESGGEILNRGLYNYKIGYGGGDVLLPVYIKHMS